MSSVPGVYTNTNNSLPATVGAPGTTIAVIGHSSTYSGNKFATGQKGDILRYDNINSWLDALGRPSSSSWVDGTLGDSGTGTAGTSPFDPKDNLLRAIELIYAANPSADVIACVLDGQGSNPQTAPDGLQEALDELLLYDVAFVVVAGYDPLPLVTTHVETAASSNEPYNSPRFYVTGADLFYAWDVVNSNPPLDSSDLTKYSTAKSSKGLTLAYIGDHIYAFNTIDDGRSVEIGGQFVAAYIAGLLAKQPYNFPITNFVNSLGNVVFNGDTYNFRYSELNEAINDGWLITRFVNNTYVFAKGITYTTDSTWSLYPVRSITNYLHKALARGLFAYIGKVGTASVLSAAKRTAEGILLDAVANSLINTYSVDIRQHPTEVDALRAIVSFETVKPINKIYLEINIS